MEGLGNWADSTPQTGRQPGAWITVRIAAAMTMQLGRLITTKIEKRMTRETWENDDNELKKGAPVRTGGHKAHRQAK